LSKTDSTMKRTSESPELNEVSVAIETVVAEIAATTAAIEKVEQQIEAVETNIEIIQSKTEAAAETEVFPKGYSTIEEYIHDIRDEKSHFRVKEDKLRVKEDKLRVKEQQLRDRLAQLGDDKRRLEEKEEGIKKQRMESTNGGRPVFQLKPFDEYSLPFEAKIPSREWQLDFVMRPEFQTTLNVVENPIRLFESPNSQLGDKVLEYPVVDGASGSGKSRLVWEVCMSLVKEGIAHSIFVDCSKYIQYNGDERNLGSVDMLLARLLVTHFCGEEVAEIYKFTLGMVIERIIQTGRRVVLIQLDEYSANVVLCRAVLRSCYDLFANSTNKRNGVLVVPILSGITYINIRNDLLEVSRKTTPRFISLAGIQETEGLEKSFYETFGRETRDENLGRIMATFGGFPRLYTWLLDEIEKEILGESVGSETSGRLYDSVKTRYSDTYPIEIWIKAFARKTGNKEDARVSECTIGIAKNHLKRIHTIAVSGVTIRQSAKIDASIPIGMTYQELSAVGLYTMKPDPEHPTTRAVIIIPLILLDAYCDHTGICARNTLSPFAYSWQSMEHVAMWTLRCFWNSFYFIGQNEIYVDQLRPGVLHNNNGWL